MNEDIRDYFFLKISWEWEPTIALERVASRIYGEYLAGDWTFEELMASCGAIHLLEGQFEPDTDLGASSRETGSPAALILL